MGVARPLLRMGLQALGAPYLPSQLLAVVRRCHSQSWFGGLGFQSPDLFGKFERSLESHQRWKVRFPETAPGAVDVVMFLAAGLSELQVRPCLHWRLRAGGEVNWMERILSSKGWGGLWEGGKTVLAALNLIPPNDIPS